MAAPRADGAGGAAGDDGAGDGEVREQDRYLPVANISRIMRRGLPPSARVSKEAKEAAQEAVSEFISFITSEASDKCMQEKRKTINGDDLLWAMGTLGFDAYIDPLRLYLGKYREANKDAAKDAKEAAAGRAGGGPLGAAGGGGGDGDDDDDDSVGGGGGGAAVGPAGGGAGGAGGAAKPAGRK
jgi:nuclear transcription Y subunit beta